MGPIMQMHFVVLCCDQNRSVVIRIGVELGVGGVELGGGGGWWGGYYIGERPKWDFAQ